MLVIAELLGVPALATPTTCGTGRRRSCGCTRSRRRSRRSTTPCARPQDFAGLVRELVAERRATPADDLITDLVGDRADRGRGGRRGRAAAQRRPRGLGQRLRQRAGRDAARAGCDRGPTSRATVEEMLRFDSALQLFERTATEDVEVGDVTVEQGQKIAVLLGAANRDPAVFDRAGRVRRRPRPQPAPGLRGRRALLPRRPAGPDGARRVAARAVRRRSPTWRWPASRRAGGPSCCGATAACP